MRIVVCFLSSIVFAGALGSCNYTVLKQPANASSQAFGELMPDEKAGMMNYAFINSRILQPKCVSCHGSSGNVNLETADAVQSYAGKIMSSVFVEGTMPKRGALNFDEKRWLWNWLRLGAPLKSEIDAPVEDPLVPTYESIRKHVFEAKCLTCHNATDSGKRISLDYQALLDSPLELIMPGNADESGLIIALERIDDKRMPPAKEGYSALPASDIRVIREWIDGGAK